MINNISNVDAQLQRTSIAKTRASQVSISTPMVAGFKLPTIKQKATIRVSKYRRADNIVIVGEIDDDYVDIVENKDLQKGLLGGFNFFQINTYAEQTKFLKNCYVIDYIFSPTPKKGLGTEAVKQLAEKAMFDPRTEGRIVTFSTPVWHESSPALFFYKLGFRFMDPSANEYMQECLIKKVPDIPPQIGMMYLPKTNLHRLLRYGDVF